MKRLACATWAILLSILIAACRSADGMIEPGGRLGAMEFVKDYKDCEAPNLNELCTFQALETGTCLIPASIQKFWVSSGWVEGSQAALNLAWEDSTWRMTFDDHEVDLEAFGTSEIDWSVRRAHLWDVPEKSAKEIHHNQQKGRMWNVCVSNPEIGKHTIRYEFRLENGIWRGNHVETYAFIVVAIAFP